MRIADITCSRVSGRRVDSGPAKRQRQVQALDVYEEFRRTAAFSRRRSRRSGGAGAPQGTPGGERPIRALYVEVKADDGTSGLAGPLDEFQVYVIIKRLKPFLLGRDALATELLHDQMLRLDRHGRSGAFVTGVSAVDQALWDLKGKRYGEPVYRLLGGPTRGTVPAYASMLGHSVVPDEAAAAAREEKARGFAAQKWFFRHGPGDGEWGKAMNVEMARAVRDAVGPDYALMFDAYMGWDAAYAVDMARRLAPIRPAWLEEPVPPERVGCLKRIREAGVPVATGEHIYTRWQFKELLSAGAVDVLQPDPDWTGGITEQVKICALASAFGLPVVAHGHSLLAALQVAAAQPPAVVPWVEYLLHWMEAVAHFHRDSPRPEAGSLPLPTAPGLGIVLDEEKIESREEIVL